MNNLSLPSVAAGCPNVCGAFERFQVNPGWGTAPLNTVDLGSEAREEEWPGITICTSWRTRSFGCPASSRVLCALHGLRKPRESLKWFISAPTLRRSKLQKREVKPVSLLQSRAQITGRHKKSAQGSWLTSKWEERNNEWKETRS